LNFRFDIVGGSLADIPGIVEVAPIYDNPGEVTLLAAAEVVHSLIQLMADTPVKPKAA
jgi:hypothetical protein